MLEEREGGRVDARLAHDVAKVIADLGIDTTDSMPTPVVVLARTCLYAIVIACIGIPVLANEHLGPLLLHASHAHSRRCYVDGRVDAHRVCSLRRCEPIPIRGERDERRAISDVSE